MPTSSKLSCICLHEQSASFCFDLFSHRFIRVCPNRGDR